MCVCMCVNNTLHSTDWLCRRTPPLLICHVHKLFVIKTAHCVCVRVLIMAGNTEGVYTLDISKKTTVTSDIGSDVDTHTYAQTAWCPNRNYAHGEKVSG